MSLKRYTVKMRDATAKKIRRRCYTHFTEKTERYVLIWGNGVYTVGEPWVLAKQYLKVKKLFLRLKKIGAQLYYFIKFRGERAWIHCRPIYDSGDYRRNAMSALSDYFHYGLKSHQEGFRVFQLRQRHRSEM